MQEALQTYVPPQLEQPNALIPTMKHADAHANKAPFY